MNTFLSPYFTKSPLFLFIFIGITAAQMSTPNQRENPALVTLRNKVHLKTEKIGLHRLYSATYRGPPMEELCCWNWYSRYD